eukprot:jgi/Botrbrau1/3419/Bobra.0337s0052.1
MDSAKLKSIEEQYRAEIQAFQQIRKDITKANSIRQQFVQQLHENDMVLKELSIVQDNANVYKLIGPVLVKQDPVEAKSNVEKRLDFIKGEMKRMDIQLKGHEERAMSKQAQLVKMQQEAQRLQQQMRSATTSA